MRYSRDGYQVRGAKKKKRPLPQWYLDEPPIPQGADLIFDAYADLQTCRVPDGAIPWTAAREYATHRGLDPDVFDILWAVIKRMDRAERKWHSDNLKRELGRDD